MARTHVLVVSDSVLKLSKKWYHGEVAAALQQVGIALTVRAVCGATLLDMVDKMKDSAKFDAVIVLSMGNGVDHDLRSGALAKLADLLGRGQLHLVLYGGPSEWWRHIPSHFEETSQKIRAWLTDKGLSCQDGRWFFQAAGVTRDDFDGANHFRGSSREKAVAFFELVVRQLVGRGHQETSRREERSANQKKRSPPEPTNGDDTTVPCGESQPKKRRTSASPATAEEARGEWASSSAAQSSWEAPAEPDSSATTAPPAKRARTAVAAKERPSDASRNLVCASPNCWYLVHTMPEFGGFCCRKCHWVYSTKSKARKKHGERCERREAGNELRAPPTAPASTGA